MGQRGAREAAERGDITIIVDVLSFSSTVTTAAAYGAVIYPHSPPADSKAERYAAEVGAVLALGRAEAARSGGRSLSPLSFTSEDKGRGYVICSLNGAACTWVASQVPALLIGCFLNVTAAVKTANQLKRQTGTNITVIACGERWADSLEQENNIRPGIEDYLGAGAILSGLGGSKSPEAQVCIGAYEAARPKLAELIWECGSGRELRERGFEEDVRFSIQMDKFSTVPVLNGRYFVNADYPN